MMWGSWYCRWIQGKSKPEDLLVHIGTTLGMIMIPSRIPHTVPRSYVMCICGMGQYANSAWAWTPESFDTNLQTGMAGSLEQQGEVYAKSSKVIGWSTYLYRPIGWRRKLVASERYKWLSIFTSTHCLVGSRLCNVRKVCIDLVLIMRHEDANGLHVYAKCR